jgi:hypothetical protein
LGTEKKRRKTFRSSADEIFETRGITKLYKVKNQSIRRKKTGAQNIVKEIKQYQQKRLQHVQRMDTNRLPEQALHYRPTWDDRGRDGRTKFTLRIKEQAARLTLHVHDDDDDVNNNNNNNNNNLPTVYVNFPCKRYASVCIRLFEGSCTTLNAAGKCLGDLEHHVFRHLSDKALNNSLFRLPAFWKYVMRFGVCKPTGKSNVRGLLIESFSRDWQPIDKASSVD